MENEEYLVEKTPYFILKPIDEYIETALNDTFYYFQIIDNEDNILECYDVIQIKTYCKIDMILYHGKILPRIWGTRISFNNNIMTIE